MSATSSNPFPFTPTAAALSRPLADASGFGLREIVGTDGLRLQVLPSGAIHALRHRDTLLNQLLPGPVEDGLLRLLVRWDGVAADHHALVGAGLDHAVTVDRAVWHQGGVDLGWSARTTFLPTPDVIGWVWRIELSNTGSTTRTADLWLAQDLGLADLGAVRNNEAYLSQYIDLRALTDADCGPVVVARQNQPQSGGCRPWLATACLTGAQAWCTDGWQFFGADHRLTGQPAALASAQLPSKRLQYEFALAGLQSRTLTLQPGERAEVIFACRYVPDHPEASGEADLSLLDPLRAAVQSPRFTAGLSAPAASREVAASWWPQAPWLHGREATEAELQTHFGPAWRQLERDPDGAPLSFFIEDATHVVTRRKEARLARPHGLILRSGDASWIDREQFGTTCLAAGVFGAQAYLGNPSLSRLLSVVRNQLNVARASGQRVLVAEPDGVAWQQLGVPSAWCAAPDRVKWIYLLPGRTIEAEVWCSPDLAASHLRLQVTDGDPLRFLVTHQLVVGPNEFDHPIEQVHATDENWVSLRPATGAFVSSFEPGLCFALAAGTADEGRWRGDGVLYPDGRNRQGPYLCFESDATQSCSVSLLGAYDLNELPSLVAAARAEVRVSSPARSPLPPVRLQLSGGADQTAIARVGEVLPWFNHNAAIHFSAPHGLDQYGGAAWGVRDVTQGSLEWLLATGQYTVARRMLVAVFAQQYLEDGAWPQWFMPAPFQSFQQAHSHGDVCFWPLKALCDYVAATGETAFLQTKVGYTDITHFNPVGPAETLWAHCDRVIAHVESRFVPGTALVNYGDGDWDDTLQPADPSLRTRMVSAWTVALSFQTFGLLAEMARQSGETERADRLDTLVARIRRDFAGELMPDGIVAGFLVNEADGSRRPLLHPRDAVTGIRYRLLPMIRSVIAGLFTADEASRHMALVALELRFADGVRLMNQPADYRGGVETLFRRAESAANVGREIGLQYVHAHLRYAEAMARLGHAEELWWALQVVNPVGLDAVVPGAVERQANVYFSSSDADFPDRETFSAQWSELRAGRVPVKGGWRLYSSGPGLYLHKVRSCLLGVRECYDDIVFDPVLPESLDGLVAKVQVAGRDLTLQFRVGSSYRGPQSLRLGSHAWADARREPNPYRPGGLVIPRAELLTRLAAAPTATMFIAL